MNDLQQYPFKKVSTKMRGKIQLNLKTKFKGHCCE